MTDPTTHDPSAVLQGDRPTRRKGRRRGAFGKAAAAATGAAVVLGAGVGTSYALTTHATGGASTPSGAVQALLSASDHADVLGALSDLAPGERAALEPNLVTLVHELSRLQVLSPGASLRTVGGLALQARRARRSPRCRRRPDGRSLP